MRPIHRFILLFGFLFLSACPATYEVSCPQSLAASVGANLGDIAVNPPILAQRQSEKINEGGVQCYNLNYLREHKSEISTLAIAPSSSIDIARLPRIGSGGENTVYSYNGGVLRALRNYEGEVESLALMLLNQDLSKVVHIRQIVKTSDNRVAFVMERLEQKDLFPENISEKDFAKVAQGLADTLIELHRRGYSHGDVSGNNFLFRGNEPVLIDFSSGGRTYPGTDDGGALAQTLISVRLANQKQMDDLVKEIYDTAGGIGISILRYLSPYESGILFNYDSSCTNEESKRPLWEDCIHPYPFVRGYMFYRSLFDLYKPLAALDAQTFLAEWNASNPHKIREGDFDYEIMATKIRLGYDLGKFLEDNPANVVVRKMIYALGQFERDIVSQQLNFSQWYRRELLKKGAIMAPILALGGQGDSFLEEFSRACGNIANDSALAHVR